MASIPADEESISLSARSDHLLDPETPLRNPETINYPSKEDPSVIPSYFVLTPSGFLHEYSSSDPAQAASPLFSLFLPFCTLGPAVGSSAKSHKFHIEGRKDGTGSIKTGSLRIGHPRQHADALERSGAVAAAVRAAGYVSEEEEEGEEEGSSVEEQQHAAEEEEVLSPGAHPHDVLEPAQPGYLYTHHASRGTLSPEAGANLSHRPIGSQCQLVADAEDETDGMGHAEVAGVGAGRSAGGDNTAPPGHEDV
ncbi:hypothetical protein EDB83DRAFT_2580074 [Lactarius deliciosus]|nr:hypothetical protein EDB83DRAFT_2580074 [Lactarius deliciosus]